MTQKDTFNKPKLSLLPYKALRQAALVREFGINKYGDDAYHEVPVDDFVDAALRHLHKYANGELDDEESRLSHLSHALASVMLAIANSKHIGE